MTWTARMLTFALVAVSLLLLGAGRAAAQTVCVSPPQVSYYYSAPAVTYYSPPVSYTPAPSVSYYTPSASYYTPSASYYTPSASYYTPSASYYTPSASYYTPSVSYYAAPAAVTTTRYGVFGRPRVSTTYYP